MGRVSPGAFGRGKAVVDDAVELLGGGIHNLRALITDLRPAALDELGSVDAGWAFETLGELSEAEIDGMRVLLPAPEPPRR